MKDMSHAELLAYAAMVKRLEDWAATIAGRDDLIREAHEAGASNTQIAKLTAQLADILAAVATQSAALGCP